MPDKIVPPDYLSRNRERWTNLCEAGCEYTRPITAADLPRAKERLDPFGWIDWRGGMRVLVLAGGGGQQGPLFASTGADATVYDLTPAQLARDEEAAKALGLSLRTVQGDMNDLSPLAGETFDLVYQPESLVFVPEPRLVYRQVRDVLKPDGFYILHVWTAIAHQIKWHWREVAGESKWPGYYPLVRPYRNLNYDDGAWDLLDEAGAKRVVDPAPIEWQHTLYDYLGALCEEGFVIDRLGEPAEGDIDAQPGSFAHTMAFISPEMHVRARLNSHH